MDKLFLILKENQPCKIVQHLQPHKLLRQLMSNTHAEAHTGSRVSEGFRDNYPGSLSVSQYK